MLATSTTSSAPSIASPARSSGHTTRAQTAIAPLSCTKGGSTAQERPASSASSTPRRANSSGASTSADTAARPAPAALRARLPSTAISCSSAPSTAQSTASASPSSASCGSFRRGATPMRPWRSRQTASSWVRRRRCPAFTASTAGRTSSAGPSTTEAAGGRVPPSRRDGSMRAATTAISGASTCRPAPSSSRSKPAAQSGRHPASSTARWSSAATTEKSASSMR